MLTVSSFGTELCVTNCYCANDDGIVSVMCGGFLYDYIPTSDGVSRLLETWFFVCRSWLSLDTLSSLGPESSVHVSVCLTFHDCVLTVSLSGTAKCLFCAETLTFLAERRRLGSFRFTYLP